MLDLEKLVCSFLYIQSGVHKHLDIFLRNDITQNENLFHTMLPRFELMLLKVVFWPPRLVASQVKTESTSCQSIHRIQIHHWWCGSKQDFLKLIFGQCKSRTLSSSNIQDRVVLFKVVEQLVKKIFWFQDPFRSRQSLNVVVVVCIPWS